MVLILSKQSMPTRSFYMPEATLMALGGVGVYQFDVLDGQTTQILIYPPGDGAFQYYEVSQIDGEGSWWTPTTPVNLTPFSWNNTTWGGITNLVVKGEGIWVKEADNRIIRPAQLFWWIPNLVLTTPVFPVVSAENKGELQGVFPQEPPGGVPEKPTVEATSDGFLIRVPPRNDKTTVTLAKETKAS